jgi:hypothetical protein
LHRHPPSRFHILVHIRRGRPWLLRSSAAFLSSLDQLGQFLSGIEHTCFYSRRWHVENVRYFVDRLLVVIDQVDDLTMLGDNRTNARRTSSPRSFSSNASSGLFAGSAMVASIFSSNSAPCVRRRRADSALWRAIANNHVETEERRWKRLA